MGRGLALLIFLIELILMFGWHFSLLMAAAGVVPGFMVQFGLPADPNIAAQWHSRAIDDDPPSIISNTRGTVSFASSVRP